MVAKFPKAFQASAASDEAVAAHEEPVPVPAPLMDPMQAGVVTGEDELEAQVAMARAEVERLPVDHPKRQELLNDLLAARAGSSAMAVANVRLEADKVLQEQNAAEGQKLMQAAMGGIVGLAALSELVHLGEQVAPHGKAMLATGVSSEMAALGNADHFTPAVNPGMQVAILPAIDRGQGIGPSPRN